MIRTTSVKASLFLALLCGIFAATQSQAALVSYYPLDGNLNDVVGPYNGTAINGPLSYVASPLGQAVDFNGSNQYATLTTGNNFGLNGNFTVSAFINSDNLVNDHTILGNDGGNTNDTLHLVTRGTTAHLGFYANDRPGNATLSTGTWTHVTYQYNNGTQAIYVNGVPDAADGGHAAFAGGAKTVNLGSWGGTAPANVFDGRIDNLAIYNTAIGKGQVAYLASGGDPRTLPIDYDFGNNPTLQGWTVQSGGEFFRPDEFGGIAAANSGGGFAHDPSHTNFLVSSPTIYFKNSTVDGTRVLTADFRGGMGDQDGLIALFPNPASVINNNGGVSSPTGVKAVGILDVATGQYKGFLLDPGNADDNGTVVGFTAAQLQGMGIQLNGTTPYRLDFFDNDQDGWGWTQLNRVTFAGSLTPVPEPSTMVLALIGVAGLVARRWRKAA